MVTLKLELEIMQRLFLKTLKAIWSSLLLEYNKQYYNKQLVYKTSFTESWNISDFDQTVFETDLLIYEKKMKK